MPTKQDIEKSRSDRARFLCAVWDSASKGESYVNVSAVLHEATPDLDDMQAHYLVRSLIQDDVLEGTEMGLNDITPREVWLTSDGRREVERWVSSGEPTEHLPITHGQVFNNHFHGTVTGSNFVAGSRDVTINQVSNLSESIASIVEHSRRLLDEANILGDDRDDVENYLATLSELAERDTPDTGRIKAALRGLGKWTRGVVVTGTAVAMKSEVTDLTTQLLNQIGG